VLHVHLAKHILPNMPDENVFARWMKRGFNGIFRVNMLLFVLVVVFAILCMLPAIHESAPSGIMLPMSLLILTLHFSLTEEAQAWNNMLQWFPNTQAEDMDDIQNKAVVVKKPNPMLAKTSISKPHAFALSTWKVDVHNVQAHNQNEIPSLSYPTYVPAASCQEMRLKIPF
jgi:hypothetical protein